MRIKKKHNEKKGATLSGFDGAGHAAIVEKINSGGAYKYLGCIYKP